MYSFKSNNSSQFNEIHDYTIDIDQLGFEPFAESMKTEPKKNRQKLKKKERFLAPSPSSFLLVFLKDTNLKPRYLKSL